MSCLLTVLLTLPAADPDAAARAALALAIAVKPADDYATVRARAVAEGKPLLIWVGVRRPDLERADWLHHRCATFPGATPPCVVVGRPSGGEVWRAADLPAAGLDAARLAAVLAPPALAVPRRCGPNGCW